MNSCMMYVSTGVLSMAQANNRDVSQIGRFFKLPPLESFEHVSKDPAGLAANSMEPVPAQ